MDRVKKAREAWENQKPVVRQHGSKEKTRAIDIEEMAEPDLEEAEEQLRIATAASIPSQDAREAPAKPPGKPQRQGESIGSARYARKLLGQGCGKCRWGRTGCLKCNPDKEDAYKRRKIAQT